MTAYPPRRRTAAQRRRAGSPRHTPASDDRGAGLRTAAEYAALAETAMHQARYGTEPRESRRDLVQEAQVWAALAQAAAITEGAARSKAFDYAPA
ncbi:hypothetical protein OG422_31155 (plasmid) [Streptomyces sp. NBC_01525]|uniref:hypothetical protein n=1 Tax=Streptomyces sp. NBC_01525 TaxID=2903893 RepID=UPI002F90B8D8